MKTHSSAFDGLLSLIPAKYYYDEATQDQWKQKKKLKKEAMRDRMAKLDPDSADSLDSLDNAGVSAKAVKESRAKSAEQVRIPMQKEPSLSSQPEVSSADKEEPVIENVPKFDDEGNEIDVVATPRQQSSRPKKELLPEELQKKQQRRTELKERLASKIHALKEKRKAPGSKLGGPVKSREQMLAERKRKQESKQEKLKRKREADDDEAEASDNSDANQGDGDDDEEESEVMFGNIEFKDGTRMTSDLKNIRSGIIHKKRKGPANNDIKAHLLRLEAKKRKLEQMSPEDRKKAEEQRKWKGLIDQAEGVKVKNDEKLLKKSLKRKDKQKLKSGVEWNERKQVVKDTIAAHAKRREENLKTRRENKGKKSKNQVRLRKFTGTVNKAAARKDQKKRAGFEGCAKSKNKVKK